MTDIAPTAQTGNVALSRRPVPHPRDSEGSALSCFGQFCESPLDSINLAAEVPRLNGVST